MTDDQFERIKKGLNFHSEGGVYNLCTLTETTLRTIIEDAVKFYEKQQKIDALHIMELQKQNGELTDKVKELEEKLKQAEKGKVVERFEAYGQCRDSRRIAELEKENAELKDDNKVMADNYSKMEQKFYDNLTKAKELLKQWVELFKPKGGNIPPTPIQVDTEQFLKEVEK